MQKATKIILIIVCVVVGFVIAALLIAPRLFDVDHYRPDVISYIEQNTGRQIEIGHLGLSVFPSINIRVDQFGMANPPGFSRGDWLTVQHIHARLDLHALWNRQIVIKRLDLDKPVLNLESDAQGRWNYQIAPRAQASVQRMMPVAALRDDRVTHAKFEPPSSDPPLFSLQEISKVVLNDGQMTVRNLSAAGEPSTPTLECRGISSALEGLNFAAFTATTGIAKNPSANATGTLSVDSLSTGSIEATKVESDVAMSLGQVQFNHLRFNFYDGHGKGNVLVNLAQPVLEYHAEIELSDVDVAKLLNQFPASRGAMTGKLDGQMNLFGKSIKSSNPWEGKQGNGTVIIHKGRWLKLQLNKNLLELAHVAQLGPASGDPSAFSSISARWQLANSVLTTPSVHIIGTGITVDGSGRVELSGANSLHYQGIAEFAARQNPLTNILANISGATYQNGQLKLPFVVNGTLQRPLFQLETARQFFQPPAATSPAANPNQPPNALQNLFKLFQQKKR
ncbi:MAG TPA: AsmA family protein [Terriglobia bacterium]|nr:AsmA family protein [Terriglobia bacterium]